METEAPLHRVDGMRLMAVHWIMTAVLGIWRIEQTLVPTEIPRVQRTSQEAGFLLVEGKEMSCSSCDVVS